MSIWSHGDRKNECRGLLIPINVLQSSKKGEVIIYQCSKCKKEIRNIVAQDDSREEIYKIVEKYSRGGKNGI